MTYPEGKEGFMGEGNSKEKCGKHGDDVVWVRDYRVYRLYGK
jgi:hypothetical protein